MRYAQSISDGILSGSNLNSENWRSAVNTSISNMTVSLYLILIIPWQYVTQKQKQHAAARKEGEIINEENGIKMKKEYRKTKARRKVAFLL
jgi:hypothetical protein